MKIVLLRRTASGAVDNWRRIKIMSYLLMGRGDRVRMDRKLIRR